MGRERWHRLAVSAVPGILSSSFQPLLCCFCWHKHDCLKRGDVAAVVAAFEMNPRDISIDLFSGFGKSFAGGDYGEDPAAAGKYLSGLFSCFGTGVEDQNVFIEVIEAGDGETGFEVSRVAA